MSYIGKSTPISIIDNVSKSAGGTFGGDVTVNGTLTATSLSGDGSNLTGVESDLVFDTTPQLGGNLDLNGNDITGTGSISITGGIFSNDFVEVRADDSEIYLTNAANNKYFRIKRDGSDIDFDIYNGSSVSTKLMLTEDGILQGISNSEIKTSPIRIHTNTINQNTTIDSSENAVSGGPITIASGVTVTVNGDWTVV
tara:strand:+ start:267 stop:857 length:591 start_codon:yes stop_codon:yes gene_type:complete